MTKHRRMKLLIVTDAWFPQINGVVRTISTVCDILRADGHEIEIIGPNRFRTIPCPSYPEIRLAWDARWRIGGMMATFAPDAVHIATEGPLGLAARRFCLKHGWPFTTAYHTRFPEYVSARVPIPESWLYAWLRRFHGKAARVMVATKSMRDELEAHGFGNVAAWSRGVDTDLFRPRNDTLFDLPRPIWLYVGRVSVEKNIAAFLDLELDGTKVVVGDGPMLAELRGRYSRVHFTGAKRGEDLARHYASADVFVFPSRTDTFGLVMLEALASGVPVAAYPVPGPLDVINGSAVGCLDEDLGKAARAARDLSRQDCRDYALEFSWRACADQFLENIERIG